MGQSLCRFSPWCHGARSLRCFRCVNHNGHLICNDIAHLSFPGDIVHVKHIFIQRPKTVESFQKNGGFPMLLCSDGIQAVSLGLFVQGIVLPSCIGDNTRGAKTGIVLGFFGLDSVGLYWLEFSGYLVLKPLFDGAFWSTTVPISYQQVFRYDF